MKRKTGGMNSPLTDKKQVRRFGLVAFLFFGSLCALAVWKARPLPTYLFGFLWLLGTCFLLFPGRTRPIYAGWLKVAHFIGRALTAIMLTAVYFLVITPAAFLKRLFGGRPLPLRPDKKAATYWVARQEPAQPRDRFLKRF
jgi:hypothetical protein